MRAAVVQPWLAKLGGSLPDETCRPLPSDIIVSDGLHPHPGPAGWYDDGGGGVWDWMFPNELQQRPLTASAAEVIEAGSEEDRRLDGGEVQRHERRADAQSYAGEGAQSYAGEAGPSCIGEVAQSRAGEAAQSYVGEAAPSLMDEGTQAYAGGVAQRHAATRAAYNTLLFMVNCVHIDLVQRLVANAGVHPSGLPRAKAAGQQENAGNSSVDVSERVLGEQNGDTMSGCIGNKR